MAATIASLLTDFSPAPAGGNLGIGMLRSIKQPAAPEPAPVQAAPSVDRQAELIRSVEARVRAEERAAASKLLDEALAAEKTRHEQELNAEREVWIEQQALQLSSQIQLTLSRIETDLADRLARILRPFLVQAYQVQAIADFKETLATILSGTDGSLIKITGPEDVLTAIEVSLGPHGAGIEFLPSEHVEVSLMTQNTVVQTQLNSWLNRLEQALKVE